MGQIKGAILKLLRETTGHLSGEKMSNLLGVSRVAVWKHIRKLMEYGYSIKANSSGYSLSGKQDFLYPWEFSGREAKIHFFNEIDSTMRKAALLSDGDCPHGTLAVADRQTEGRGRANRKWQSGRGGLYFTTVLRIQIPVMMSYRIVFASSVAMARILRKLYGLQVGIKWPNDILAGENKLAGILTDIRVESDLVRSLNLGIGVNVNNEIRSVVPGSDSICELIGRKVSRRELLSSFLDEFDATLSELNNNNLIGEWKSLSATLGRSVRIVTQDRTVSGRAVDLDERGALIVRESDGSSSPVIFGDCSHITGETI